jgi:Flp pilus assembly protein TadG
MTPKPLPNISPGWRLWRSRRGAVAPLVAASAVVLFGMAGFVLDVGAAMATRNRLQASTDAAALAGALEITANCGSGSGSCTATQVKNAAIGYSSGSSGGVTGNNPIPGITVTAVSAVPKCFTSTGVSCSFASGANGIQVTQTASVQTTFARIFRLNSIPVSTTSTAGAVGGVAKPLNVMIIIDTTGSMSNPDPNCGNVTKLTCALEGARTIMETLSPSVDNIGLMVFPPLTSSTPLADDYNCGATLKGYGQPGANIAEYGTQAITSSSNNYGGYQIVALGNNYRPSGSAQNSPLSSSSNLVTAAGGGSGCLGVQNPGGTGTYYADAITAAQNALAAEAQPNSQNVIIFMSDGAANATSSNNHIVAAKGSGECYAAYQAAQAAAAAHTWVYSLAYDSQSTGCTTDSSPWNSPCYTMQQIASDPTKFFSDNSAGSACPSGANPSSGLVNAFQGIAIQLLPPRLLPDGTT